ncbi:MAG: 23S rRNA (pseudouridine(1915)-N(3))-methyltransferase RlmH [Spirochaetes bacterium]|nr:23S rRNA (pseudouridine(1915)-N(3))-methyltransferase RlmH [Spirochaetota bacterium]
MKIKIFAVGKLKKDYNKFAVEDYLERIKFYMPIEIIEVSDESITDKIDKNNFNIILDGRGKELSSLEFATFISQTISRQNKDIAFFIGGADGFDEEFLKKGNFILSLSKLTFPHELARVILLEQIYRAFTIINNEKYHK